MKRSCNPLLLWVSIVSVTPAFWSLFRGLAHHSVARIQPSLLILIVVFLALLSTSRAGALISTAIYGLVTLAAIAAVIWGVPASPFGPWAYGIAFGMCILYAVGLWLSVKWLRSFRGRPIPR